MRSAEEVARGVTFGSLGREIPRITLDLHLPAFKYTRGKHPYAWPPKHDAPVIDFKLPPPAQVAS